MHLLARALHCEVISSTTHSAGTLLVLALMTDASVDLSTTDRRGVGGRRENVRWDKGELCRRTENMMISCRLGQSPP